jgi:hypothetical protein
VAISFSRCGQLDAENSFAKVFYLELLGLYLILCLCTCVPTLNI